METTTVNVLVYFSFFCVERNICSFMYFIYIYIYIYKIIVSNLQNTDERTYGNHHC